MILLTIRRIEEFQKTIMFFVCALFLGFNANATKKKSLELWYNEPAETIHPQNSKPGNVHYTPEGYEQLASYIKNIIKSAHQ